MLLKNCPLKKIRIILNEIEIPKEMGLIVRTAGSNKTKNEINNDEKIKKEEIKLDDTFKSEEDVRKEQMEMAQAQAQGKLTMTRDNTRMIEEGRKRLEEDRQGGTVKRARAGAGGPVEKITEEEEVVTTVK